MPSGFAPVPAPPKSMRTSGDTPDRPQQLPARTASSPGLVRRAGSETPVCAADRAACPATMAAAEVRRLPSSGDGPSHRFRRSTPPVRLGHVSPLVPVELARARSRCRDPSRICRACTLAGQPVDLAERQSKVRRSRFRYEPSKTRQHVSTCRTVAAGCSCELHVSTLWHHFAGPTPAATRPAVRARWSASLYATSHAGMDGAHRVSQTRIIAQLRPRADYLDSESSVSFHRCERVRMNRFPRTMAGVDMATSSSALVATSRKRSLLSST